MSEIADALKSVLTRIGNFFDLFDLSFFVSGSVALAGLVFGAHLYGKQLPFRYEGWLRVLTIIMACYVLGLLCFAVGRSIRIPKTTATRYKKFETFFSTVLKAHGLSDEEPFKSQLARANHGTRRLYIRLWAEIRQKENLTPSLLVLNRYWVMAAMYDGMVTALLLWAVVVFLWWIGVGSMSALPLKIALPLILALLFLAFICSREAARFLRNQVEELVATIAFERSRAR
jgi:hypothetical protein